MLAMQERHIVNKNVSKKRPIYLQTAVFTPLSIRRGGGGEAVVGRVASLYGLRVRLSLQQTLPKDSVLDVLLMLEDKACHDCTKDGC